MTEGRLAVICGATGGIGPSVVNAFADRGDSVVAVSNSKEELKLLDSSTHSEVADLTLPDEVEELWRRIDDLGNGVRWLVNLTGGWRGGSLTSTSADDYRSVLDLNLTTAWLSCHYGAGRILKGGGIVNVASQSALTNGAEEAAYSVAKAGVLRLTQVLADELKETGVRCNVILPAVVNTPANRDSLPADVLEKAASPEEIAKVILFLCSDESVLINGAAIPVFGRL